MEYNVFSRAWYYWTQIKMYQSANGRLVSAVKWHGHWVLTLSVKARAHVLVFGRKGARVSL